MGQTLRTDREAWRDVRTAAILLAIALVVAAFTGPGKIPKPILKQRQAQQAIEDAADGNSAERVIIETEKGESDG